MQDSDDSPTPESPTKVDVPSIAARIALPDEDAKREASAALGGYHGALGRLGDLALWLAGSQGRFPTTPPDHPVLIAVGQDASPDEQLAQRVGATVHVVEVMPAHGGSTEDGEDSTTFDTGAAFQTGVELTSSAIDGGADLLMFAGSGLAVPAAATVAVLANKDVASTVGHAPGMDDREWMIRCAAVRDTARRARPHAGTMINLLTALESPALATMAGALVEATARRTPVVLDDVAACAAALVAQRVSYRTARWLIAAHRSPDPAHTAALERLRLDPVLDYRLVTGGGSRVGLAALLALSQIRAAATLLHEVPE